MTQIVGITGYKRSGKGEVARLLSEDPTVGVVYQIGFADKVKQLAARALGLEGSPQELIAMMDDAKLEAVNGGWWLELSKSRPSGITAYFHDLSGREFLQHMGTEARKLLGEDLWVDQVLPAFLPRCRNKLLDPVTQSQLARMYPEIDVVAITDLRFQNEAQRVRDLGGVVWEVLRPGTDSDGHDSEQRLPVNLIDWQIMNNSSLGDLREQVGEAIQGTLN